MNAGSCENYDVVIVGGGPAGLFVAGDGPGVAGNIVSAAATGLIPAKEIIRR